MSYAGIEACTAVRWGQRPCERPALAEEPPRLPCFHSINFYFLCKLVMLREWLSQPLWICARCNGPWWPGVTCDIRYRSHQNLPFDRRRIQRSPAARSRDTTRNMQEVTVHSLHLYPIKSCRPVDVRAAHVTPTGEEMDACSVICRLLDCKMCDPSPTPPGATW